MAHAREECSPNTNCFYLRLHMLYEKFKHVENFSRDPMSFVEVEVLVADSGAFIKAAPLEKWAGRVFTVKEVVEEIRDVHTRRRLQALPYEIVFREPSQEALQHGESSRCAIHYSTF